MWSNSEKAKYNNKFWDQVHACLKNREGWQRGEKA